MIEKTFVNEVEGIKYVCSRTIEAGDTYYYTQSDGKYKKLISKNGFFDDKGLPFELPHCFKIVSIT